jgi:hypothetical protein
MRGKTLRRVRLRHLVGDAYALPAGRNGGTTWMPHCARTVRRVSEGLGRQPQHEIPYLDAALRQDG